MEKYIHVTKDVRLYLAKTFNVSDKTVWNALNFDKKRGETDCAKRIRKFALQKGGIVMVVVPEVEVLYDYDGVISQYFPNGRSWNRTRIPATPSYSTRESVWDDGTTSSCVTWTLFSSWLQDSLQRIWP